MSVEIISLLVLLAMFVVASLLPINLGVMGFVAAFIVGSLLAGLSVDDIFAVFPGSLFVLLAGITFLFAIAQQNGTIDLLMRWGVRGVMGNVGLIPWVMFALTALLAGVGALSAAAVAIVAPVAMRFASQCRISPLFMGVMVVQGATAGSYSPISPFGAIVNGVLGSRGLPQDPTLLFLNSLVFNLAVAAVVFVAFGGIRLMRRTIDSNDALLYESSESGSSAEDDDKPLASLGLQRTATLVGIVLLVVLALFFGVDVGIAAFMISFVLLLIAPYQQAEALRRMPWPVILLICGVLTYVGVLDEVGTIAYMQDVIAGVGSPVMAALAASYVGGAISAFASTAAILGASIPLAEPILQSSGLSAIGVVSAIAISSAIVDISPLSTNGALLLANAQNIKESKFFRQLLFWAVGVTALGPLLAWLVFVVIGVW